MMVREYVLRQFLSQRGWIPVGVDFLETTGVRRVELGRESGGWRLQHLIGRSWSTVGLGATTEQLDQTLNLPVCVSCCRPAQVQVFSVAGLQCGECALAKLGRAATA